MKKIIYFVGFSFLMIGLNSCGESKAVVVGEGEGNNRYTESQNEIEKENAERKALERINKSEKTRPMKKNFEFKAE